MAHFRGTIQGNRGTASRLGSKASGLTVEAQSWQGKVVTYLYTKDGTDYARVTFERHHSRGTSHELYDGPVSGPVAPIWPAILGVTSAQRPNDPRGPMPLEMREVAHG